MAVASFIGTTVEWYDFFIYGTAAALVFDRLFFPNVDPLIGTLSAFATFAVGFAARPLGGVIFGHYGDRIGRKTMLVASLLLMGMSTFLIGVMPTYATVGIAAPIMLVALRFAQGIAAGGEWGGAVLMAVESAPPRRRGLFGSWPQMGVPAGLLAATGMFILVQAVTSTETFMSWAWRVPFLFSIVLVGIGLFIRLRTLETPAFERLRETEAVAARPVAEVIRTQRRELLLATGMRIAENATFYILTVFVLTYGEETLQVSENTMLAGVMLAAAIGLLTIPLWGALSDRVGRRPPYLAGAGFTLLFAFPFFLLVDTKEPVLICLAIVLGVNLGHDLMYGPQAAYFAELFGARVRYSGASLGYQIASAFAGGLAPLIATALLVAGGESPWLVATYMTVMAAITVVATLFAPETLTRDVHAHGVRQAEQEDEATYA